MWFISWSSVNPARAGWDAIGADPSPATPCGNSRTLSELPAVAYDERLLREASRRNPSTAVREHLHYATKHPEVWADDGVRWRMLRTWARTVLRERARSGSGLPLAIASLIFASVRPAITLSTATISVGDKKNLSFVVNAKTIKPFFEIGFQRRDGQELGVLISKKSVPKSLGSG